MGPENMWSCSGTIADEQHVYGEITGALEPSLL